MARPWLVRAGLGAALLLAFLAVPAAAAADLQTVEFETGALNQPLDGQQDISFPKGPGFRPYRVEVSASARIRGPASET
jgi:hypothetical protein